MNTAKMKFLLGFFFLLGLFFLLFSGGNEPLVGGIKLFIWRMGGGSLLGKAFSGGGEMSRFLVSGGGTSPIP